ncbi:MAG: RNA polymerase sigma factor [Planctomycetota bacterium]
MSSTESEEPRIERAIDGDGEALEELLRECGPRVAAGICIDPRWRPSLESEDVMQVNYLAAYLRIFTLQARTMAGFRGWLARIAENNLRDAVRALQRDKRPDAYGRAVRGGGTSAETLMATLVGGDATAGSIAAGREAVSRLRAAIARLPASYRRVVDELDLAERPVAELAAELGKSPGAVHMLRSRAHDRLKELLGGATRFFYDSP